MALWWVIGKYGMRLNLGVYYRKRKLLAPLTAIILVLYGVLIKVLVDANPGNAIIELIADKTLFATLIDLALMYLFIYLIIIHVFTGIRRQNKSSIELLLSAPVSSQDIVLGETIAMVPIYLIFLPVILIPLCVLGYYVAGVGILGLFSICISQVLLFILAIGAGAIILSIIQSSIQRIKFSKYFRVMASMLAALLYLSIYSLSSWLDTAQSFTQNTVISYLPTSLSSRIIYSQILDITTSPSALKSYFFLCAWIVVIYAVGIRVAGRVYSLEKEIATGHVNIQKKEGVLYSIVRRITPSSSREMVITHFKVFFRDSQNFSTSVYIMMISYFIISFALWNSRGTEGIWMVYLIEMAITPIFVSIFVMSMFYLSKDALWIWKKAPHGLNNFIKSKWIQTFILSFVFLPLPFVGGIIADSPIITVPIMCSTVLLVFFMNAFSASFAMFLNIMNPSMSNKGAKVAINTLISTFSEMIILIFVILFIFEYVLSFGDSLSFSSHLTGTLTIGIILSVIGVIFYKAAQTRITHLLD